VLIDAVDTLPVLFGDIFAPPAVVEELKHQRSPKAVRQWAQNLPTWLNVRSPRNVQHVVGLHRGEIEAIALAEELSAKLLLIDAKSGQLAASERAFRVMGTLGVIAQAAIQNLINVEKVSAQLRQTNFRGRIELIQEIVDEYWQRGDANT